MANGDVIWQIQNNGSKLQLFFFSFHKKYNKQSQITIPNSWFFREKMNLEVANASNNL
jgi:hypothetical protein